MTLYMVSTDSGAIYGLVVQLSTMWKAIVRRLRVLLSSSPSNLSGRMLNPDGRIITLSGLDPCIRPATAALSSGAYTTYEPVESV